MSGCTTTRLDNFLQEIGRSGVAGLVITDPDIVAGYSADRSRFTTRAVAAAVLAPRDTDEVALCLRTAHHHSVPVIARGAGSGLSGAANAATDSVVLSLHRMADIIEIDPSNRLAVVQPGVVTADLRAAATDAGLCYPPDPGSVEFSTIGGNIATNAGGMCCVKYGVTGDFVLALEVVLADGRILRTGHRTVKGVAGYDLARLFVGSEGTLGVITEATLRLVPAPRPAHTLVASFATLTDAGELVSAVVRAGLTPSMLEILDRTTVRAVDRHAHMDIGDEVQALLLIQEDGSDAAETLVVIERLCTECDALDVVVTDDPDEGAMLLHARRLALTALEALGDWLLDDVSVPRTRIVDLIAFIESVAEQQELTIGVFGHAGDGNLHPTIIFDESDPASRLAAEAAFDAITGHALRLGGTITGEHGVGQLKKRWLAAEQGPVAMEVQRAVKSAFDPTGILNPRSVLDPTSP